MEVHPLIGLQYRLSRTGSWKKYNINSIINLENIDNIVQFRNTNDTLSIGQNDYVKFIMKGDIEGSGDIQSMLNYSPSGGDYCYTHLFYGCTSLTKAPELTALSLGARSYTNMFKGCSGLIEAPELPAKTIGLRCYESMFHSCTNLENANDIYATSVGDYCFNAMFQKCSKLKNAPKIHTSTLSRGSCQYMFADCTGLVYSPDLNATTLNAECYSNMFNNCSNLVIPPALPATNLNYSGCYSFMFKNCTSLTTMPDLPALFVGGKCYLSMFSNCTSLKNVSHLPATTIASSGYYHMFENCKNIVEAPKLNGTTLNESCYEGMFYNCVNLKKSPDLHDANLAKNCYDYMFYGCSNLNYIKINFTSWEYDNTIISDNWVEGVSPTGTFIATNGLDLVYGINGIPENWEIHYLDYGSLTFEAKEENASIKLAKTGSPVVDGLQYRMGTTGTWLKYNIDSNHVLKLQNIGDKVQFRNIKNTLSTSDKDYVKFQINGIVEGHGDIQSMLNYSIDCNDYCYYKLFNDCSTLVYPPELPAKTIANHSYDSMFYGCTNLLESPVLDSKHLGSSCYKYMFCDCENISSPPQLPATELKESCYEGMFCNCTFLTQMPELPATELKKNCYNDMFDSCVSLTETTLLPAIELVEGCYNYMFAYCEKLNKVKVAFENWVNGCTREWLSGVSPTGTFLKPDSLTDEYGINNIPNGWSLNESELVSLGILPKPISEFTNDDIGTIVSIPYSDSSGKILLNNGCIEFEVVGVNHHKDINDASIPTITLMTKNIIRYAAFDAQEPNNPLVDDSWDRPLRQSGGNNRWSVSNIHQWLNSEGSANEWFTPQHEYDEAPTNDNVFSESGTSGAYADDPGFLDGFSTEIKQHFATVKNKTILCDADKLALSKDYEETEDKVFLPSYTEMGFGNLDDSNPEGSHLDKMFIDNNSRVKSGANGCYWLRTNGEFTYWADFVTQYGEKTADGACKGDIGIAPLIVLCENN
jgi:hypothetical protein